MGAENGRVWASAPTGVMDGAAGAVLCRCGGGPMCPPICRIPVIPCRGRRPRRPALTARPAPAERGRKGIRALPGPKVSPRASRFIKAPTRECQPSPAGGRRYALARTDPPWRSFLLDRARPVCLRPKCRRSCGGWPTTRACGRSLFGKTEKKMGGALSPATRHPPSDPDAFNSPRPRRYSPLPHAPSEPGRSPDPPPP